MALTVSTRVGGSSYSGLIGSCRMLRIAESWTLWFAVKRVWKCSDQRQRLDALSVRSSWPSELHKGLWIWWVGPFNCFQAFIESSIVASVCIQLNSHCQVVPPLVLDLSELALENVASAPEGRFLHGIRQLSRVGLMSLSLFFFLTCPRTSTDVLQTTNNVGSNTRSGISPPLQARLHETSYLH